MGDNRRRPFRPRQQFHGGPIGRILQKLSAHDIFRPHRQAHFLHSHMEAPQAVDAVGIKIRSLDEGDARMPQLRQVFHLLHGARNVIDYHAVRRKWDSFGPAARPRCPAG